MIIGWNLPALTKLLLNLRCCHRRRCPTEARMELEQLREYYSRCNPYETLSPDDHRNVDIDQPSEIESVARGILLGRGF